MTLSLLYAMADRCACSSMGIVYTHACSYTRAQHIQTQAHTRAHTHTQMPHREEDATDLKSRHKVSLVMLLLREGAPGKY